MYLNIILNLLLVLAVIAIYIFITWRVNNMKKGKNNALEIIATLPLGSKEKIMIVKFESKKIMIGVTSHSINVLSYLSDNEVDNALAVSEGQFNRALNDYMDRQMLSKDLQ